MSQYGEWIPLVQKVSRIFEIKYFRSDGELLSYGFFGLARALKTYNKKRKRKMSLYNWIYAAIRNEIIDGLRKESGRKGTAKSNKITVQDISFQLAGSLPDPVDLLMQKEREVLARKFFDSVRGVDKQLLIGLYYKDQSVTSVAKKLKYTKGRIAQKREEIFARLRKRAEIWKIDYASYNSQD